MKTPTVKSFIENSNLPAQLIRATINQFGGFERFQEVAEDVTNHGIDGGFNSFIYHEDTVKFSKKNKKLIMELAEQQAADIYGNDTDAFQMLAGFNCLKSYELKPSRIAALIHGREPKEDDDSADYTGIFNALAWYAGEEVARAWCDYLEQLND